MLSRVALSSYVFQSFLSNIPSLHKIHRVSTLTVRLHFEVVRGQAKVPCCLGVRQSRSGRRSRYHTYQADCLPAPSVCPTSRTFPSSERLRFEASVFGVFPRFPNVGDRIVGLVRGCCSLIMVNKEECIKYRRELTFLRCCQGRPSI